MSGDSFSSLLNPARPLHANGLPQEPTIISGGNLPTRNLYHQLIMPSMNSSNGGSMTQMNLAQGNPYMPYQPMLQNDFSSFSPIELYNLECARRIEAEQLAARRRQLECLQSYRALLEKSQIHLNKGFKYQPQFTEPISPALSDQHQPLISSNGLDDGLSKSPLSYDGDIGFYENDVSSEEISIESEDSYYSSFRASVSPPEQMQMPPLTRIIDADATIAEKTTMDNNHKKASKIRCTICGENAICKSYGAICCDSCRLFFRRTVVKEAHKSYSCSAQRKCIVTGRHRSRCQFCRFQRCLLNGMKPEYVLKNNNDKNITSADLIHSDTPPAQNLPPTSEVDMLTVTRYNESLTNNEAFDVHGIVHHYEKMRFDMTPAPLSKLDTIITTFKDLLSLYLTTNLFSTSTAIDQQVVRSIQNDSLTGALMLRLAYYYDPVVHGLPHCRLFAPSDVIHASADRKQLIPMSLYEDILRSLKSIHLLKIDNTIVCLLILVYISQTDSTFEFYMSGADEIIDKFTLLLKKYIASVHGPLKASELFPKLLMKLCDVKELQMRLDKYVRPSSFN